jgi:hypothetical protein
MNEQLELATAMLAITLSAVLLGLVPSGKTRYA